MIAEMYIFNPPMADRARPPRKTRGRQKVGPLPRAQADVARVGAGPVAVRVEPSRAASQACVVVEIPLNVNPWVFAALRAGAPGALHDAGLFDQSVTAFAAFEAAAEKLAGTIADANQNKVSGCACGAQDGQFLVSVTCAPTLASARKCAGIVLQQLRWGALYQRYEALCKRLGVRPDKAAHAHAASTANAATQRQVTVVVAGKAPAAPESVARMADALAAKVKDAPPKERGRARTVALADVPGAGAPVADLYVRLPAAGLPGLVAYNFVESKTRGEPSELASGFLYVPLSKEARVRLLARDDAADKYAASLARLGAETAGALVFVAAKGCLLSARFLRADTTAAPPAMAAQIKATLTQ